MNSDQSNHRPFEFGFEHSYAESLPGFSVATHADEVAHPEIAFFNTELATGLKIPLDGADDETLARLFSGNQMPEDANPVAQVYAGHQFGQFNPQLGDGRALILGELVDSDGQRTDVCFKGSGRTAFSRGGDGKAALAPMLREVLIAEAMYALGVPTTRSLSVVSTGETVYRETPQPGAVLTRTAASHIRIGTFEYFAARGETSKVKQLADYTIARHYPDAADSEQPYLALLNAVIEAQAELVAKWMSLGFIHGVMNTDNMSIAGETIDYGPCAFMDIYDPETVFSSIDRNGRYAYQNQPGIAQWNLARFAETLLSLIDEDEQQAVAAATESIKGFAPVYEQAWLSRMQAKLGVSEHTDLANAKSLIERWLGLLETQKIDFTLAHRSLVDAAAGQPAALKTLFADKPDVQDWMVDWHANIKVSKDTADKMRCLNPLVIPRNHLVEEALEIASQQGDLQPFNQLLEVITNPFDDRDIDKRYLMPASQTFTDGFRTFCGT